MLGAQRGSEDTVRWWFVPPEADRQLLPPQADVCTMSGLGRQYVNNRKALVCLMMSVHDGCQRLYST